MAAAASVTAADPAQDNGPAFAEGSNWHGVVTSLGAGAVLFASLIIGSPASLFVAAFLAAAIVAERMSRRRG